MSAVGLSLSGGGFRATLYHLGLIRFLRDANILQRVSHITSVSGGSIMAAHLVLNWQRYTGSEEEFDEAAEELLDFIRFDVRNRIVRRFPLAFAANGLRWLLRQGRSRRLTRPGLLEVQYEKFLYGDKCLYELPAVPQLHMLATNINEGCLCSFTRTGLLVQKRLAGGETRFESVPSALATIPMAVTASSAFPGFFPPIQFTADDVGAEENRFPPHLFTDGGVYDNLGVRMFRHIRKSWIGHDIPLQPDDFVDLEKAVEVLSAATQSDVNLPLARLAQLVKARTDCDPQSSEGISPEALPQSLWNVIVHVKLYCETAFEDLEPDDELATDLCHLAKRGRELDAGDHLWLNRYLANAAFAKAEQGELLCSTKTEFDTVIVSDAAKKFAISRQTKGGGLLGAALRASDILMDRVWQLEIDHFGSEPDFVFAPLTMIVQHEEDPTALHPEIQHQVTEIRTDLDRCSELEISGLIRHGYGVMRKVCRSRPNLFGDDLPSGCPWDPTSVDAAVATNSAKAASKITEQARTLQRSSHRVLFGRFLSWRDWPSYIYVPLILLLIVIAPYFAYQSYRSAVRSEMIVDAITYSNPDFQLVLQIARKNPIPGQWKNLEPQEVSELKPSNLDQFELAADTRVYDLRAYRAGSTEDNHRAIVYRRMSARRLPMVVSDDQVLTRDAGHFRFQQLTQSRNFETRCDAKGLEPIYSITNQTMPTGEPGYMVELDFNLSSVPTGSDFNVGFEVRFSGIQGQMDDEPRVVFPIVAKTEVATMWVMLPPGRPYTDIALSAYETNSPSRVETIEPSYRFDMADGSLFGWMLVSPRENYTYESRWTWHE